MTYAILKLPDGTTITRQLPVVIGANNTYDLSIAQVDQDEIWLAQAKDAVVIINATAQKVLDATSLAAQTQIEFLGTSPQQEPSTLTLLSLRERHWLSKWQHRLASRTSKPARALGHCLSWWLQQTPKTRIVCYGLSLALATLTMLTSLLSETPMLQPDSSQTIYQLAVGDELPGIRGNAKQFAEQHHMVRLAIKGLESAQHYKISFQLWGQTHYGRTQVATATKTLWQSVGRPQCIASGCYESFQLVGADLLDGDLTFSNTMPHKDWAIRAIKVTPIAPVSAIAMKRISKLLNEADETSKRQHISKANLFRSRDLLAKVALITGDQYIPQEVLIRIRALEKDTELDIGRYTADLFFAIEQAIRTEQFNQATLLVNEGERFFPHADNPVAQKLRALKNRIAKLN